MVTATHNRMLKTDLTGWKVHGEFGSGERADVLMGTVNECHSGVNSVTMTVLRLDEKKNQWVFRMLVWTVDGDETDSTKVVLKRRVDGFDGSDTPPASRLWFIKRQS